MRYVTIDRLEQGCVLAKPIYDDMGRVLLGLNGTLTKEIIRRLEERGLQGCYIEDELSKDINIQEIIPIELRNKGVDALKTGNIDAGVSVAKNIVEELLNHSQISLDMIDLRTFDDYTFRHSVNVAVLSTVIGMGLQMSRNGLEDLCIGAIFHDIGKQSIDSSILNKPGKLTRAEYETVKKHPQYSYDVLKSREDISCVSRAAVLYHHENVDGTGYPLGKQEDEIPLYARIIHVADVYDALISRRPYKMPYALSEAIEYLMGGCNMLFDRDVVVAFLKCIPIYPVGTIASLSDGSEGIIIRNTGSPLRPVIRLYDGTEINLDDEIKYRNVTIVESTGVQTDFINNMQFFDDEEDNQNDETIVLIGSCDT